MRDITLRDIAEIVSKELLSQGIRIPRRKIELMIKNHFNLFDKVMSKKDEGQFAIWGGDLTRIYRPFPGLKDRPDFFDYREFDKIGRNSKARKPMTKATRFHRRIYEILASAKANKEYQT